MAGLLAPLLGQSFNTVRERLRDTYREADTKRGFRRNALELTPCWGPWLAWVLEGWSGRQLALVLGATSLSNRFVVLTISVVYRGCAVPVARKILHAAEKHPWRPEWLALLAHFRQRVPGDWTVIVRADRGLYAKWLFKRYNGLGLASLFTSQPPRPVSPARSSALDSLHDLGPGHWSVLAGTRHDLQR